MKKFCVKCGHEFEAVGREVICPSCKAAAAEESKRAAVMRAKRASWAGESVPVRISGRASTVIRAYGAANNLPFAQALDELLKSTDYFKSAGQAWKDIEPYRSHRRDKATTEGVQDKDKQDKPVKPVEVPSTPSKPVVQAAKATTKSTAKKASSKAVKASKAVKTAKA